MAYILKHTVLYFARREPMVITGEYLYLSRFLTTIVNAKIAARTDIQYPVQHYEEYVEQTTALEQNY